MKWPLGLAAFAIVGYGLSGAIGEQFENPEGGESGFDAVMMGLAIALFCASLLAVPLAVILGIASLANRQDRKPPGDFPAADRPAWSVSHNSGTVLALIAYAAWLAFMAFSWFAATRGGGGLDGPCFGGWAGERPGLGGHCTVDYVSWPPLSARATLDGDGVRSVAVFPDTPDFILLVALSLLPLALWPLVRWATNKDRQGQPPLRRLALLVGVSVALALAAGALLEEESSRPLTEDERIALEQEEERFAGPSSAPSPVPPSVVIDPTRIDPMEVGLVVSRAQAGGTTTCAPGTATGLGLWTCVTDAPDGSELSARLAVQPDGSWEGVRVDHRGVEQPLSGCCVAVRPES